MTYWREFSVNACAAFARGMPHDDDVIRAGIGRKLADEIDRLAWENVELRGLLRTIRYERPAEVAHGGMWIRFYNDDFDRIDAALSQPSSPLGQGVEGTPGGGASQPTAVQREVIQYVAIRGNRAVICGIPATDHDCDAMGCPSTEHILYRVPHERDERLADNQPVKP